MKTISDLNSLIPILIKKVLDSPETGKCYPELSEDGWDTGCDYADNNIWYEEDGWLIIIYYRCGFDGEISFGEVTEITANHYDEDTDEETVFSENDLTEMWDSINKALEKF